MTHFHDFARPDGTVVTVEFTFSPGSPPTYTPMHGADGGDATECEIVKAFAGDAPVELPDDEREKYEEWLVGNYECDEGDFYFPD
jgi:hypothetical protein